LLCELGIWTLLSNTTSNLDLVIFLEQWDLTHKSEVVTHEWVGEVILAC
jgi:hypothetical protein